MSELANDMSLLASIAEFIISSEQYEAFMIIYRMVKLKHKNNLLLFKEQAIVEQALYKVRRIISEHNFYSSNI